MSFNLVDYFIIAVILLSAVSGLYQGLVKAVGGMISIIAGILAAALYYDDCLVYLEQSFGVVSLLAEMIRNRMPITALSIVPDFSNIVRPNMAYADTAHWLANIILIGVCFILIFLISSKLLNLFWKLIDSLFSWGLLSWINRIMGMVLVVFKNMVIMAVITGLLYPSIELAGKMGFDKALAFSGYIDRSIMADNLIILFNLLKGMLGLNV